MMLRVRNRFSKTFAIVRNTGQRTEGVFRNEHYSGCGNLLSFESWGDRIQE